MNSGRKIYLIMNGFLFVVVKEIVIFIGIWNK